MKLVLPYWVLRLILVAVTFAAISYGLRVAIAAGTLLSAGEKIHFNAFLFSPFAFDMLWPLLAVIGLELIFVGWRESSLRRLLWTPSASALTDWAFLLLSVTGLYSVLIALCGFGIYGYIRGAMFEWHGFDLFTDWPLWASLPALYFCRSFFNYWIHRLQHTRWFWPLHKTHHAALDFTTINYLRAHPIEVTWQVLTHTIVLATLGFRAETIIMYEVISNYQQFLNHSNATALAPLEKLGFVTPAGHRIHHGVDEQFHNRNFGELLNIWDRIFGTYTCPRSDVRSQPLGVDEGKVVYNTENLLLAFWAQSVDWCCTLRQGWPTSRN